MKLRRPVIGETLKVADGAVGVPIATSMELHALPELNSQRLLLAGSIIHLVATPGVNGASRSERDRSQLMTLSCQVQPTKRKPSKSPDPVGRSNRECRRPSCRPARRFRPAPSPPGLLSPSRRALE